MCSESLIKIDVLSLLNNNSDEKIQSFTDANCAVNAFDRFFAFYEQGKFTDFILSGRDHRKFQVHSVVLAAVSDYFYNICSHQERTHHFNFVDSETLEKIIGFCYTGQVELTPQNIEQIIYAAHELGILQLKLACTEFLDATSNEANCLQYAIIAEKCGLRSSEELSQKFLALNCANMCKTKKVSQKNAAYISDIAANLSKNECDVFENVMKSVESIDGNNFLLLNAFRAIYQSFFIAGYVQSIINTTIEKPPTLCRENTFEICKSLVPTDSDGNDEGLFIIAKSKCNGAEIYAISEFNRSLKIMPKYHINTDKINIDTVKLFPVRDRIYFSCVKDQRLMIKSWTFKRQTLVDVLLPTTVQYLKPRLTNAVGESFFVTEEKYCAWPYEGYKTTVCKFGLESESYKCIEVNCGGMKEIIGIGDEIFVFNQKAEVFSFNLIGGKRIPRGSLNHNGIIKAVVFHGNVYVGCYIRSKCNLFVEQFKRKTNQWTTIGSICTYTDASNYHIGVTDNYLYVFHGKGKVQRYSDASGQWTSIELPDNFNQNVLCVSTSPFTCFLNNKF